MSRKYYSVTNVESGQTGYASVGDMGFPLKEKHVCKLLIFLEMLPEGNYISREIDAETYFANVDEKELEEYAYV